MDDVMIERSYLEPPVKVRITSSVCSKHIRSPKDFAAAWIVSDSSPIHTSNSAFPLLILDCIDIPSYNESESVKASSTFIRKYPRWTTASRHCYFIIEQRASA